ncbi:hypothetical protein CYMTET_10313 [Cymbomonas tetramitiformis]|uniref:Uncharacterized protein n=1 Tax=Cymbomonas tetramitiformis TaxID=36881 RepID=A0AAE0GPF6_9CHLO|nr:hypothetical protein CYMTET_10313 [Cymbomonas tetramitiformis]
MVTEAHGAFADELVDDKWVGRGGEALKFAGGDGGRWFQCVIVFLLVVDTVFIGGLADCMAEGELVLDDGEKIGGGSAAVQSVQCNKFTVV